VESERDVQKFAHIQKYLFERDVQRGRKFGMKRQAARGRITLCSAAWC